MNESTQPRAIAIWDPFVRLAHWTVVAAFLTAYITGGEPRGIHTAAGYLLAAYVGLRVVWGFVGPERARFASFVRSPISAIGYLVDLLRGRATRHLGHSPAGGLMIVLLLLALSATTSAGMMLYALHDGGGPLAGVVASETPAPPAGDREDPRVEFWEESHELLANLTLLLVLLHIGGVVVASIAHRENLVKAMITGRKRP
ncbi:MAG TPA: cytochrome b/b6 domain-containing protein [Gammaproteobacteria bacterium]